MTAVAAYGLLMAGFVIGFFTAAVLAAAAKGNDQ